MKQTIQLDSEAQETLVGFIKVHRNRCNQSEIRIMEDSNSLSFWCTSCGGSWEIKK